MVIFGATLPGAVHRAPVREMITRITGNTFDHRDHLKSIGSRWNGVAKCWTVERLSETQRAELVRRGLIVSGGRTPPMPGMGPQPDLPPMPHVAARAMPEPEPVPVAAGTVQEHGTDNTYRGYFAITETLAYFGFNSFADHVEYVRRIPQSIVRDYYDTRNVAWTNDEDFSGTYNMAAALKLADEGWQEGTDNALQVLEMLTAEHAKRRKRRHALAGGNVSVGRMLAGNPLHMVRRPKREGNVIKTLFVDSGSPALVTAENLIVRAAVVAAAADMLENNGYSCEIVAVNTPTVRRKNRAAYQCVTRLKQAGEKLNLPDLVFALGHPSYLRRMVFATVATDENCRSIWDYMGQANDAFTDEHPPGPNEYYIEKIERPIQEAIGDGTLLERALRLFPLIVPENFPIQLSEQDE